MCGEFGEVCVRIGEATREESEVRCSCKLGRKLENEEKEESDVVGIYLGAEGKKKGG